MTGRAAQRGLGERGPPGLPRRGEPDPGRPAGRGVEQDADPGDVGRPGAGGVEEVLAGARLAGGQRSAGVVRAGQPVTTDGGYGVLHRRREQRHLGRGERPEGGQRGRGVRVNPGGIGDPLGQRVRRAELGREAGQVRCRWAAIVLFVRLGRRIGKGRPGAYRPERLEHPPDARPALGLRVPALLRTRNHSSEQAAMNEKMRSRFPEKVATFCAAERKSTCYKERAMGPRPVPAAVPGQFSTVGRSHMRLQNHPGRREQPPARARIQGGRRNRRP